MALTPGSRLGSYEIVSLLGEGGMGQVYRATDTNLKRQVALKVLPDSAAGDAERLARFRREAEVLAALNHPHIAAIYGLEVMPSDVASGFSKSFQRKDGPPDEDGRNFHGQVRKNDTHASKTDPDAKLYRKSNTAEARLAYLGHIVIENRHGLIVDAMATTADGRAEREAGLRMLHDLAQRAPSKRRTVGADKNYDTAEFVARSRALHVTPHVSQNRKRSGGSAVDARTTRHPGYAESQACRPRVERPFGWMKAVGWIRKVKLRGVAKVNWLVVFASAAFNLRRLSTLTAAPA